MDGDIQPTRIEAMAIEFWEDSDHSPLEALLESIRSLRANERILEMKVDADEGLVEGDEAYTWIQLSNQKPGMIAWCMKDDDGEFELDTYEMNLEGVDSALSEHFDRQDQYSWTDNEALIKQEKFDKESKFKRLPNVGAKPRVKAGSVSLVREDAARTADQAYAACRSASA